MFRLSQAQWTALLVSWVIAIAAVRRAGVANPFSAAALVITVCSIAAVFWQRRSPGLSGPELLQLARAVRSDARAGASPANFAIGRDALVTIADDGTTWACIFSRRGYIASRRHGRRFGRLVSHLRGREADVSRTADGTVVVVAPSADHG